MKKLLTPDPAGRGAFFSVAVRDFGNHSTTTPRECNGGARPAFATNRVRQTRFRLDLRAKLGLGDGTLRGIIGRVTRTPLLGRSSCGVVLHAFSIDSVQRTFRVLAVRCRAISSGAYRSQQVLWLTVYRQYRYLDTFVSNTV